MPHGSLTPSGRQLRSVLANLRSNVPKTRKRADRLASNGQLLCRARLSFNGTEGYNRYHTTRTLRSAVASRAEAVSEKRHEDYQPFEDTEPKLRHEGAASALRHDVKERHGGRRLGQFRSFAKVFSDPDASAFAVGAVNDRSHNEDSSEPFAEHNAEPQDIIRRKESLSSEHRLYNLLNAYVRHEAATEGAKDASSTELFEPTATQQALMNSRGYILTNLKGWAKIIAKIDAYEAVTELDSLRVKHGPGAVPVFVISLLLRRRYVPARALRTLMPLAWASVEYHQSINVDHRLGDNDVFHLFWRFLHHARVVWPSALDILPDMLLQHLAHSSAVNNQLNGSGVSTPQLVEEKLEALTFKLNKAMRLLAVPTSVEPFKSNSIQEKAIIKILRFMSEHDPPLGINREGYRSVFLVQLAQRKTSTDSQWAELKALSWPPWKVERTAMDADITAEHHGSTTAAKTLEQMRDAGYGLGKWERSASLLTGWDTDRTPTIQTRFLFAPEIFRISSGSEMWATRIAATRTVQEAWACYLAFEDSGVRQDQFAFLAIFRKLYEEQLRLQGSKKYQNEKRRKDRLWPGDTREIEPLPPSTHLHTYTLTLPPTVDGLYRQLRERGVTFYGPCLAFLVANAPSLRLGLEYLYGSMSHYPLIRSLLIPGSDDDISRLPKPIFAAFLELLGRFSKVPLHKALPLEFRKLQVRALRASNLYQQDLNLDHPIIHAISLLKRRPIPYRPAWNSILRSLGNESTLGNLPTAFGNKFGIDPLLKKHEISSGSIAAYLLVRDVLALMKEVHLDLDIVGFQALCQAAENLALNCWLLFRQDLWHDDTYFSIFTRHYVTNAERMMRAPDNRMAQLKGYFATIVGEEENGTAAVSDPIQSTTRTARFSALLEVPSPAPLHAYVRAVGWSADYEGLLKIVRWMVRYKDELTDKRGRDRNGETVMRRAIISIRVFLERAWLPAPTGGNEKDANRDPAATEHGKDFQARIVEHLRRLETPASNEVIEEVKELVESVEEWGGWPSDEEVEGYCQHYRFQQFR